MYNLPPVTVKFQHIKSIRAYINTLVNGVQYNHKGHACSLFKYDKFLLRK